MKYTKKERDQSFLVRKVSENHNVEVSVQDAKTAINNNPESYFSLPEEMRKIEELAAVAIEKSKGAAFIHMSDEIKGNRNLALNAVELNAESLLHASENLRSDLNFCSEVFILNPRALQYSSDRIKKNENAVEIAAQKFKEMNLHGNVLQYAHNDLRGDAKFVKRLIQNVSYTEFEGASDDLKSSFTFFSDCIHYWNSRF